MEAVTLEDIVSALRADEAWTPPLGGGTATAVSACIERARLVARSDPEMSVGLTRIATAAAVHLGDKRDSRLLRANAWREHAESLAFVGRHKEAIAALASSEREIIAAGSPLFDRARLLLTRANVLHQVHRGLEAIFQVRESATIFLGLGEKQQFVNARMIEAVILHQAGRTPDALAVWRDLERDLGDDADERSAAAFGMMFSAIAGCFRMLGDYVGARAYYARAKDKFAFCGYAADVLKAEWGLAKLAICEGRLSDGCDSLEYVADRFEALSMRVEQALAELDRVEVLVVLRRTKEARRVSSRIMRTFDRVGMNRELVRALAHLHECLGDGTASTAVRESVIPHIRQFIEISKTKAAARYEPPPA